MVSPVVVPLVLPVVFDACPGLDLVLLGDNDFYSHRHTVSAKCCWCLPPLRAGMVRGWCIPACLRDPSILSLCWQTRTLLYPERTKGVPM